MNNNNTRTGLNSISDGEFEVECEYPANNANIDIEWEENYTKEKGEFIQVVRE